MRGYVKERVVVVLQVRDRQPEEGKRSGYRFTKENQDITISAAGPAKGTTTLTELVDQLENDMVPNVKGFFWMSVGIILIRLTWVKSVENQATQVNRTPTE